MFSLVLYSSVASFVVVFIGDGPPAIAQTSAIAIAKTRGGDSFPLDVSAKIQDVQICGMVGAAIARYAASRPSFFAAGAFFTASVPEGSAESAGIR